MSKSTTAPKSATAADVRAYFRADEKRVSALSPEARLTVRPGARGALHPEAVALHNKRRKVKYAPGNSKAAASSEAARMAALREQAREAGFKVGKRGPLPKAFLAGLKG